MSFQPDNVRHLLCRQTSLPRRYGRPAKVIPLHPHLRGPRPWHAIGAFLVVAIATAIFVVGMSVIALSSASDVLGHVGEGWPRW
jgi:hypothetical protein